MDARGELQLACDQVPGAEAGIGAHVAQPADLAPFDGDLPGEGRNAGRVDLHHGRAAEVGSLAREVERERVTGREDTGIAGIAIRN